MRRTLICASIGCAVAAFLIMPNGISSQVVSSVRTAKSATQPASTSAHRVGVGYAFVASWRLGGPAFAEEVFPTVSREGPIVYIGKMVPRGLLVLRSLQQADGELSQGHAVVRSKDVDITSRMQVIGAQYRKIGDDKVEWIPPDKLPKCKVRYEPLLPKEIGFPGKKNCVLLYEIGEGRENEWREGYWIVSLRFDASSLNIRLQPQDIDSVADPAKTEGQSAIHQVRFVAKPISTEADKHNLLYYTYLNGKASDEEGVRKNAIEPLDELVKAYPSEVNLLYARAQMLADNAIYAQAIQDVDRIEEILKKRMARTAFVPVPGGERMSQEQVLSLLQGVKRLWSAKAATQTTTQPSDRNGNRKRGHD